MLRDEGEAPVPPGSSQRAPERAQAPADERPQTPRWTHPAQVTEVPPPALGPGYPGYSGPYAQAPMGPYPVEESYRFRPLGERERRRIEEQARAPRGPSYPYPAASDSWTPQRQPGTRSPPTYGIDPATPDPSMRDWGGRGWGTEGYGFRETEPARRGGDRWQGPYSSPVQQGDWLPPDPGLFQEPNQWGAIPPERTPPSFRMYPSLDAHRDRRLTAR